MRSSRILLFANTECLAECVFCSVCVLQMVCLVDRVFDVFRLYDGVCV
jgi:hypothetical protein